MLGPDPRVRRKQPDPQQRRHLRHQGRQGRHPGHEQDLIPAAATGADEIWTGPFFGQLLLNGLVMGVIYALVAMGLSLIFGVLEIVNFAHGEFYMLASMLGLLPDGADGASVTGRPSWSVTVVGWRSCYVCSRACCSALRGEAFERSILLTMGLSMVLQNGAVFLFTTHRICSNATQLPEHRRWATSLAGGATLCAGPRLRRPFAALYLILHRTRIGKAMRGVAQNRAAADDGRHRRPRGGAAGRRHRHRPVGPGGRGPGAGLLPSTR